jgi:2-polyprenyl-6-methoxyphenol hydroxylase-like FAD-dependent oxidoreductase
VTATVRDADGERTVTAPYLVGADGARSAVRHLVGIDFPGRDGRISMVVADVVLTGEHLPTGWRMPSFEPDRNGTLFLLPLGNGVYRMLFGGPAQQRLDRDAPVTDDEVADALRTKYGTDVQLCEVHWASRFSDASRQAERYREGRVLLAGDAAHIHLPAGGQGLNLGMQDAFNLGWKLAAQVHGWAPDGLLDTYHSERHPIGARVLANTRAQGVLGMADPDVRALRGILADLLTEPGANRRLAEMISGLDVRYDMPCAPSHPLLGGALSGISLHSGQGQLLEFGSRSVLGELVGGWAERVEYVLAPVRVDVDAEAVLVRPDGYVCWAGAVDVEQLRPALARWFGEPIGSRHG